MQNPGCPGNQKKQKIRNLQNCIPYTFDTWQVALSRRPLQMLFNLYTYGKIQPFLGWTPLGSFFPLFRFMMRRTRIICSTPIVMACNFGRCFAHSPEETKARNLDDLTSIKTFKKKFCKNEINFLNTCLNAKRFRLNEKSKLLYLSAF